MPSGVVTVYHPRTRPLRLGGIGRVCTLHSRCLREKRYRSCCAAIVAHSAGDTYNQQGNVLPPCWPVEWISGVVAWLRNQDSRAVFSCLELCISAEAELPPQGGFIEDIALNLADVIKVEVVGIGLLAELMGSGLKGAVVRRDVGVGDLGFRHAEMR